MQVKYLENEATVIDGKGNIFDPIPVLHNVRIHFLFVRL